MIEQSGDGQPRGEETAPGGGNDQQVADGELAMAMEPSMPRDDDAAERDLERRMLGNRASEDPRYRRRPGARRLGMTSRRIVDGH